LVIFIAYHPLNRNPNPVSFLKGVADVEALVESEGEEAVRRGVGDRRFDDVP
jgi:hypothetical protein